MGIGNASVTTGKTFVNAEDVTTTEINLLGVPTVALAFTGDTNTGLSNPSADVIGIEAGGAEIVRFSSSGIQTKYGIFRDINTSVLTLTGGTAGAGANIELYGGAHATLADYALVDAGTLKVRSQDGTTTRMTVNSSGLAVGATGNAIKAIWYTSAAVDETISEGLEYSDTATVTGAASGDIVTVSPANAAPGGMSFYGYVSAGDTVTYTITNGSGVSSGFTGNINIMVLDIT